MPNDKISLKKGAIILFGIAGIILVSLGRGGVNSGTVQLIGIVILIGNNIISGFTNVIIALDKNNVPPLVLSSGTMLFGGLLLFLFSIPVEGISFSPLPLEYYLSLAWLSLLSAVAISIWVTLLKRPNIVVSDLNLWKFMIPVAGALFAWVILPDESPDWMSVAGMLITGSSLIFLNLYNRARRTRKKV